MLMNRFSAGERLQEVLPEDNILCTELGYVSLLSVHQLQATDKGLEELWANLERTGQRLLESHTFVISLCVFCASSSALCCQEGSSRAKSDKSLSKDSLAARSNLVTSCCTNLACCILVVDPTHLVVDS